MESKPPEPRHKHRNLLNTMFLIVFKVLCTHRDWSLGFLIKKPVANPLSHWGSGSVVYQSCPSIIIRYWAEITINGQVFSPYLIKCTHLRGWVCPLESLMARGLRINNLFGSARFWAQDLQHSGPAPNYSLKYYSLITLTHDIN